MNSDQRLVAVFAVIILLVFAKLVMVAVHSSEPWFGMAIAIVFVPVAIIYLVAGNMAGNVISAIVQFINRLGK